ncbi:MAG TPA: hypothetical protein VJO14_03655, partial [Bacteroidota bacterium]|nr:hypothetical protein [Bacteroidota bacterium]
MKRLGIPGCLLILAMAFPSNGSLVAQPVPAYELSVKNPVLDGSTYQFDIFVKRTGATNFRIGNSQFILTFNTAAFSGPSITRVASSEQIGTGFFFDQVISSNEIRVSLGGNGTYSAAADVGTTGNGTRISTFRISRVSVPVVSAGLFWVNLPSLIRTGVSEINDANNYRDITDVSGLSHLEGGGEFAKISGYKFEDLDGNGTWDQPAEPPLDGWTIYSAGPAGTTSALSGLGPWPTGYFEFVNLTPGSYTLSEQLQSGWSPTFTPPSPLVIAAGADSSNNNFGNFNGPTVRGTVFRDLDGDSFHDPGEPYLQGWQVNAAKTGGGSKTQYTNSLGQYVLTFGAAESGDWEISVFAPPGWTGTLPGGAGTYDVTIQSGYFAIGIDFGFFLAARISGKKFEDLNGDSVFTTGEPGIPGLLVTLFRDALHYDSVLTGAGGDFAFDGLPSGTYLLSEEIQPGWTQVLPGSPPEYTFEVDTGGNDFTGADFGNFRYGALSGEVYFDFNHNGTRDPGEAGMTGVSILLTGPKTSRSTVSGTNGAWGLDDMLADELTITEAIPPGYHLTQPGAGYYSRSVTSGTTDGALHFGNSASSDTLMYRTLSYDSLIESRDRKGKLLKPENRKPDKVEFCMTIDNLTGQEVDGLQVRIRIPIYYEDPLFPMVITPEPDDIDYSPRSRYAYLHWATPIPPGSSVEICAWASKPRRYPDTYHHWMSDGVMVDKSHPIRSRSTFLAYRLPQPNRMNVIDEIIAGNGILGGMLVGVERTDMPKFFAWVKLRRLNDFKKSLVDRYVIHTTVLRNFYDFDNLKRMKGEMKYVSPRKQNNRFFADALALKIAIRASQMTILPPGLGELIFEDGANPLSGKTILGISARADTLLTDYWGPTAADYYNMDSTLQMINRAFEGPIDTISFASVLQLKGTRKLQEVPYLRANPGAAPVIYHPESFDREPVPDRFALHQNYPNPFNPATTILFDLPAPAMVTLRIYNVLGEEMGTVLDQEELDEGVQEIDFEAGSLPTGIYFYRLAATFFDEETG